MLLTPPKRTAKLGRELGWRIVTTWADKEDRTISYTFSNIQPTSDCINEVVSKTTSELTIDMRTRSAVVGKTEKEGSAFFRQSQVSAYATLHGRWTDIRWGVTCRDDPLPSLLFERDDEVHVRFKIRSMLFETRYLRDEVDQGQHNVRAWDIAYIGTLLDTNQNYFLTTQSWNHNFWNGRQVRKRSPGVNPIVVTFPKFQDRKPSSRSGSERTNSKTSRLALVFFSFDPAVPPDFFFVFTGANSSDALRFQEVKIVPWVKLCYCPPFKYLENRYFIRRFGYVSAFALLENTAIAHKSGEKMKKITKQ